jgi:Fe-Mn family superoxide dismutase
MSDPVTRRSILKWSVASLAIAGTTRLHAESVAHALPALSYDPAGLEPFIDAATMNLHHGKHHAAYIGKLNEALATQPRLSSIGLDELMSTLATIEDSALQMTLRNNGGGHWNHSFFWNAMTPAAKSGKPSEKLMTAIVDTFGSLEKMKTAFTEVAMKRFGSGWTWLIVKDGKLKITSTPNQDNPLMKGLVPDEDLGTPILGLDVWEHAYYLHYQNRRADYVAAWWNIVNWEAANKHFGA